MPFIKGKGRVRIDVEGTAGVTRYLNQHYRADCERKPTKTSRPLFVNEFQMLKSPARSCSMRAERDSAHLELLRQAHVDEAPRRVVGEARISDRISTLARGEGWIFVEDVIAADRKDGALQEMVPDAHLA